MWKQIENFSNDVGVTINKNGWWYFPTYNRWKVVKPKQPKIANNSVKVIKLMK